LNAMHYPFSSPLSSLTYEWQRFCVCYYISDAGKHFAFYFFPVTIGVQELSDNQL
jgi:hypothetical protein